MRSIAIALALFALPVMAQREIPFRCVDGYCVLAEKDWKWLMESTMAKDRMIAKCYKDS